MTRHGYHTWQSFHHGDWHARAAYVCLSGHDHRTQQAMDACEPRLRRLVNRRLAQQPAQEVQSHA